MFERLMRLGPGLLFAGSAVGVSHLVQSTRAGAEFGLTPAVLIVLTCFIKYPVFRFGAEYSAATGDSVIVGYEHQGRWLLALFFVATVIEGVGVIPAVSLVTAGLTMNLFGFQANDIAVTMVIVVVVSVVLGFGRYRLLENITRVFVGLFSVLSIAAAVAAATTLGGGQPLGATFELNEETLFFSIAVAGWMPIGAAGSAFLSVWVLARSRAQGRRVDPAEARFDFNVGYLTTVVIALCFLVMGAALLFGSGTDVSQDSAGFAAQLIGLFTRSIGQWAQIAIAIAALAVMLSTVFATVDGFPRVYAHAVSRLLGGSAGAWDVDRLYVTFMIVQLVAALAVLALFFQSFAAFIDLVTTIGFFTVPVIAFLNHRVMFSADVAASQQPAAWLRYWSISGIAVLTAVFPAYLYFRFA